MSEPTPTPQSVLFARGVIARLAIWSTLRIAVQESWGGPDAKQKPIWIASTIVDSFQDAKSEAELPDEQYVEEMLLQIMADEFEAVLEDDSAASVAKDVVRMWIETKEGREDGVKKFEELAERIKGRKIDVKENVVSDEEWEDDDEEGDDYIEDDDEAPQLLEHNAPPPTQKNEPEVDEDGFTLVKGKGKGRR